MYKLAKINSHLRDARLRFDEEPHLYYIDGINDNISVTTYIHKLFPSFDEDKIIKNMMKGKKWKNSKYYGMSEEEIKKSWEDNRIEASTAGTNMHKDIELFYNDVPIDNDSVEFNYFLKFNEAFKNTLKPYRTEWEVFSEELKFAGSIDMIYENPNGTLQIYDWKRCKEIKKTNPFESGFEPIEHLPNSNYWHYSLQLNIYRRILQKEYGKQVTDLYLVCLHPNQTSYKRIKVPIMEAEIDDIFAHRLNELKK
jgi:ATP-dependent exoDNAse (exonuclease V) beta subunit